MPFMQDPLVVPPPTAASPTAWTPPDPMVSTAPKAAPATGWTPPDPKADQPQSSGGFLSGVGRGFDRMGLGMSATQYMLGLGDSDSFAKQISAAALDRQQNPEGEGYQALQEKLGGIDRSGSLISQGLGAAGALVSEPGGALELIGETLPSMVPAMAGGAAGALTAPVTGPLGAIAGMGLGTAAGSYGMYMVDFFSERNIDTTNEAAVRVALADPEFVNEAHWYAAKQAGVEGLFTSVAGKLGHLAGARYFFPGATLGKKARGVGVGLGIAGGAEAGTEVAQGALRGEVDAVDVAVAGLIGSLVDLPSVAMPTVLEKFQRRQESPDREQVEPLTRADLMSEEMASVQGATPTFYSALRRAVDQKGPGSGSADQWLATIDQLPGVKADEIQVSGVREFIEQQRASGEPIRKTQVLAKLDGGSFEVQSFVREAPQYAKWTVPAQVGGQDPIGVSLQNSPKVLVMTLPDQATFQEEHFGEDVDAVGDGNRNIVVHSRFHTQWSGGRRGIEIDEVQSTLHEEGRKSGYRGNYEVEEDAATSIVWHDRTNKIKLTARLEVPVQIARDGQRLDNVDKETRWVLRNSQNVDLLPNGLHYKDRATAVQVLETWAKRRERDGVPSYPFKQTTAWSALALKKMLRYAVDADAEFLTIPQGRHAALTQRRPDSTGIPAFYDGILLDQFKKLARQLGTKVEGKLLDYADGRTGEAVWAWGIELTPEVKEKIQEGFSQFAISGRDLTSGQRKGTLATGDAGDGATFNVQFQPILDKSLKVLEHFKQQFGITATLKVMPVTSIPKRPNAVGTLDKTPTGYIMWLKVPQQGESASGPFSPEAFYSTMMHEFGHLVAVELFEKAPLETRVAISEFISKMQQDTKRNAHLIKFRQYVRAKTPAVWLNLGMPETPGLRAAWTGRRDNMMSWLEPNAYNYWTSAGEIFADQVARWATTDEKPLSIVDKFFSKLARRLRQVFDKWTKRMGLKFSADDSFADWLNSFLEDTKGATLLQQLERSLKEEGRKSNQNALRSAGILDVDAGPQTMASNGLRSAATKLWGKGKVPPAVQGAAAIMDNYNRFMKYMFSMPQVAAANPHIRSLQLYNETANLMQLKRISITDEALQTIGMWRELGPQASLRLGKMIDAYVRMSYLTNAERRQKVVRKPTKLEFDKMQKAAGAGPKEMAVFEQIRKDFDKMTGRYVAVLQKDALKIRDPILRQEKLKGIAALHQQMLNAPVFPIMRFGRYTVIVRNPQGEVIHREHFETKAQQEAGFKRALPHYLPLGMQPKKGVVAESASPLMGLPRAMLQLIDKKLHLTQTQRTALDEISFEASPAHSFRRHLMKNDMTSGYSENFMRSYAHYFFHGANYLARVEHVDALRGYIKNIQQEADALPDGRKRGDIANFLDDHLQEMMDPSTDWIKLRGAIFHWALGFSPAAAAVNLSQLLVATAPYLAAKYGDVKAGAALAAAGAQLDTYYRRGTIRDQAGSSEFMTALNEAVKESVITEAMAPELAGISEGRNLGRWFGTKSEQIWFDITKASAWMFQMTEQINRRVTFRAAWNLAYDNPNTPAIQKAVEAHSLVYSRLVNEQQWNPRAARAYVAAKQAVNDTQYQYASWARPRFMRGKLGTVFVFKSFIQNTLVMLYNHKDMRIRSLLMMGLLGGMMGVPGAEDLSDMLKVIAHHFFGKDFDLEREVRKYLVEATEWPADLILHGLAREGVGIPALMSMMGLPAPAIDMSRQVGLGQISPVPLATFLTPGTDPDKAISQTIQRSSGAAFSVGFNMYRALTDANLSPTDFKRWERAMPRFLSNASRGWRVFSEGQERTATGAPVLRFDPDDPKHSMEILAMTAGFQPTRLTRQWDRISAVQEVVNFWNYRRSTLLDQANWAYASGDKAEFAQVVEAIKQFNKSLPPEVKLKAITADQMRQSVRGRLRGRALAEMGRTQAKADQPIADAVSELYPEVIVDQRPVK